jgi:hypothetical protein
VSLKSTWYLGIDLEINLQKPQVYYVYTTVCVPLLSKPFASLRLQSQHRR